MGITTLNNPNFGLSLVLGGAEVKPIDLASAYGVFANDGIRNPWIVVKKVESSDGDILEEQTDQSKRVLDSQTARLINNMLSDNSARAPIFGYSSPLYIPGKDVAAKTGTTQDNRDGWTVGYTPSLVTGVWSGNNDNSPMTQAGAGISASGPLWHEFMVKAMDKFPDEGFTAPDPVNSDKIMLNGEYVYRGDGSSSIHSILYYVNKNDPIGPFPSDPLSDPQYGNWEWAVQKYFGVN